MMTLVNNIPSIGDVLINILRLNIQLTTDGCIC